MSQRSQREKKIPKSDLSSPGLIFHVQKHPIIWDHNLPDHSDRGAFEAAFDEISKHFYGSKGRDCAELWKNLCRRRGEHKRRRATKECSGTAANPRAKPFKYAKEMSFLDAVPGDPLGEGNLKHINQPKLPILSSSESEEESEIEGEGENEEGENEEGENEESDIDSPDELRRFALDATADRSEIEDDVINYTIGNEDKDILRKEKFRKKKCKKQVKFANRREALKVKIAEQVKQHKKLHYSRKVSSVKTTDGSVTCSLDEVLVAELRSIKEDDETDLFFRSVAQRLQELPSAVADNLMVYFWRETYKELYKS